MRVLVKTLLMCAMLSGVATVGLGMGTIASLLLRGEIAPALGWCALLAGVVAVGANLALCAALALAAWLERDAPWVGIDLSGLPLDESVNQEHIGKRVAPWYEGRCDSALCWCWKERS